MFTLSLRNRQICSAVLKRMHEKAAERAYALSAAFIAIMLANRPISQHPNSLFQVEDRLDFLNLFVADDVNLAQNLGINDGLSGILGYLQTVEGV